MVSSDIKYRNYMHDIYNTFSPLNWLLEIFSLDCIRSEDNKKSKSYWVVFRNVLTASFLTGVNIYTLYYKFNWLYSNLVTSVIYTDVLQMVYDIFQYIVDLYFAHKYGSDVFHEYVLHYAYIDGTFGTEYYSSVKKRITKVMIFIISMWGSSNLCDFLIWGNGLGFLAASVFSVAYVYMLIKILTNLHVTLHVLQIESRLRVIGDLIQDYYCGSVSCTARIEDAVIKKNWFYYHKTKLSSQVHPVTNVCHQDSSDVKRLSRCYLLLTEQVYFINRMFGLRILLNCLSLLIDMVRFTNLTVRILLGTQHTGYTQAFFPSISTFWRSLTCIIVIVSLVNHCEDTYRQRERIIALIQHLVMNRTLDEKMLAAYIELRGLVQSQPINFHMAHLMRIDYPLLISITSLFVTYTIILIQSI
ncbi:uncharacterized protein LOC112049253 [Bicyclus anynana]|uniref:Gustatory receptor n=1 Tax=Bicyclus anynana TaxID=110368 RepID=A0A6J1NI73_BICAN|nr:uncharacterized protein LOC112049253 [Bicyclus anynana]